MPKKVTKKKARRKAPAKKKPVDLWAAGTRTMMETAVERSLDSVHEGAFGPCENDVTLIAAFHADDFDVVATGTCRGFGFVARSGGGVGSVEEQVEWMPWEVVEHLVSLRESVESMRKLTAQEAEVAMAAAVAST